MKLKFDKEIEDIINAIAALPDTAITDIDLAKPYQLIGAYDKMLLIDSKTKTLLGDGTVRNFPSKTWARLRRQLSFLYEFVKMAADVGKKAGETVDGNIDNATSMKESYRFLVKAFRGISIGKALEEPSFVRIAMSYGVVRLSDHEIKLLIDNNKI